MKQNWMLLLLAGLFLISCNQNEHIATVQSPDKAITVTFQIDEGIPFYQVSRNDKPLILPSRLGFLLKGIPGLDKDFRIVETKQSEFNETWEQPWGEVKTITNHYHQLVISLEETTEYKRKLELEFRVYNDGLGFRYRFPGQPNLNEFTITDELTEFKMADDLDAWWIEAYANDIDSECVTKKNKISELPAKMHTPLTMVGEQVAVSIHEAALIKFPAMALKPNQSKTLKADLIPLSSGDLAIVSTPFHTPWRTIQISSKPTDLITSYLILNLNEPNNLGDVSWIKPGKYAGIWWGMHIKKHTWEAGPKHGATTKNMLAFIDFAAENNFSGVLAEGWNEGWEGDWIKEGNFSFTKPYPDYDIEKIAQYAKEKGVGIIAHHETGGNVANYESQLEDAFDFLEKYDIHMLKTGYVNKKPGGENHQSQFMVDHFHKVMETAARHKVMIDVHEPVKDTGLRRTWPNMMTREGARGGEYEAWSEGNTPEHTVILPFTRLLSGPMDYTAGIFDLQFDSTGTFRVHTTLAKQLALYVVIYSPFQMVPDLPENYKGNPAFKFIQDVPTDWETTKVLNGEIGKYITTVRKDRNSSDWYLGSITNEEARTITFKLDFLADKKYRAEIYQDGAGADMESNPLPVEILHKDVSRADELTINLAAGGGVAIRFYEKNK